MAKLLSVFLFATSLVAAQNTANLTEYLLSQPDLSTLATAISLVPDLAAAIPSEGITILAPVNSAFQSLTNATAEGAAVSAGNVNVIAALFSYHVLNGTYLSTDFESSPTFAHTLFNDVPGLVNVTGGQNVGLIRSGDSYQILSGEAASLQVVEPDIKVGNITIHKIGGVLTLPKNVTTTADRFDLNAAAGALVAASLVETVDTIPDLTLFVPTNGAFANIASVLAAVNVSTLSTVLLYHAVAGSVLFSVDAGNVTVASAAGANLTLSVIDGTVFVNSAKVIIPNIITSNGVIHVIDSVLNPAEVVDRDNLDPAATPTAAYSGASSGSVPVSTLAPTAISAGTIPAIYTTAPAVPSASAPSASSATTTGSPAPTQSPNAATSTYGMNIYAALGMGFVIAAYVMV